MLLVADVNVIVSALYSRSTVYSAFALNRILRSAEFISPEYMFLELDNNLDKIAKRTKLGEEDLDKTLRFLKEDIRIIPKSVFEDKLEEAWEMLGDNIKDAPYLALALKMNCRIFTGDKGFIAAIPEKTISPRAFLDLLLKEVSNKT